MGCRNRRISCSLPWPVILSWIAVQAQGTPPTSQVPSGWVPPHGPLKMLFAQRATGQLPPV